MRGSKGPIPQRYRVNSCNAQCSAKPLGDHILAGSFMAEFIENDTPWVHIDLAASNHKGGLAHVPEVSELTWLLMTGTPMGLLERCHAYKEKKARGMSADAGQREHL